MFLFLTDSEKVSDYEMKLMNLDTEHLGIPVRFRFPFCKLTLLTKSVTCIIFFILMYYVQQFTVQYYP